MNNYVNLLHIGNIMVISIDKVVTSLSAKTRLCRYFSDVIVILCVHTPLCQLCNFLELSHSGFRTRDYYLRAAGRNFND